MMILYNTIVGLAAGVGLLLVAQLLKQFAQGENVQPEGFALAFGITGFIQTVLGLTISVMWPYTKVLHANIMLGEPALAFGALLLAAAFFLWRKRDTVRSWPGKREVRERVSLFLSGAASGFRLGVCDGFDDGLARRRHHLLPTRTCAA